MTGAETLRKAHDTFGLVARRGSGSDVGGGRAAVWGDVGTTPHPRHREWGRFSKLLPALFSANAEVCKWCRVARGGEARNAPAKQAMGKRGKFVLGHAKAPRDRDRRTRSS